MTDHIQIENEQYPVRDLRLTEYEVTVKVTGEDNKATYVAKTTKIKVKITKKEG